MVIDIDVSSKSIVAAHIWPASTNGRGLRRFNLDSKCLNDARNGLLLHRLIEKAFDRKQLCFIFDQIHECLKIKVLCPDIQNNEIKRGIKFHQINGKTLQLPKGIWPFRRLLNWHPIRAYEYAHSESWIDSQETPMSSKSLHFWRLIAIFQKSTITSVINRRFLWKRYINRDFPGKNEKKQRKIGNNHHFLCFHRDLATRLIVRLNRDKIVDFFWQL